MNRLLISMFLFGATMIACDNSDSSGISTMIVNEHTQDCDGVGPQKCLMVQEGAAIGTANWSYFYNEIEGFTYEEGYRYNLQVKISTVPHPPADGSSLKYTLVKINSREKL